jgi:TolB-like protein/Tfp pilus assembly protein PilF
VLPFVNSSHDPEADYLCEGITESLISRLSQLRQLRVMARSTAFRYKGDSDPQQVGRELKVGAVLTGRVAQRGDRLVIAAELVDVSNGTQLWGGQYTPKLADLLTVQEQISKEISDKLKLRLTGEEERQLSKRDTASSEAYQLYLKGRYHWNRRTEEGSKKGLEYFEQAVARDPGYALAYVGLADTYILMENQGLLPPKQAIEKGKQAATRAVELDEGLGEAHTSLAAILETDWDWAGAEQEYKRAIELNPNYATAHQWYALYLAAQGREEEGFAEIHRALELDPLSLVMNRNLGQHLLQARRYEAAIEQYQKTLELDANFLSARAGLSGAYREAGRHREAIDEAEKIFALSGNDPLRQYPLACAYAKAGRKAEARKIVEEWKQLSKRRYVAAYDFANLHACLGDTEETLAWLQKAYEEHAGRLSDVKENPDFDFVRSDPRFKDLLRRVGLPPDESRN